MIYRQLLTTTYQSEHYTNYNKNRASFTFEVKDALTFIFLINILLSKFIINCSILSSNFTIKREWSINETICLSNRKLTSKNQHENG